MRALTQETRRHASTQHGLLTTRQLLAAGFRARDIDLRVARGEWTRLSHAIVSVHPRPTDRMTQLWAAALHFERAGLAGSSALELLGLPAPHDRRIHVISPRQGLEPPFAGVHLHYVRKPDFIESLPERVATPAAVAQALRYGVTDRQAVFQAIWALQRSLVSLGDLERAVYSQPASPGTSTMKRRFRLIEPGVHSMNEFDVAAECARRGLPQPVRQNRRVDAEGRNRYTDCEFQTPAGVLVVEIDGLGHLDPQTRLDDQWRENEITLQGPRVIRISILGLRLDPERFYEQLARAVLGRRAAESFRSATA